MQNNDYKKPIDLLSEAFAAYSVEEIGVTEAINKYLFISDGSNITKFRLDIVPYMIKPILAAFDRRYKGVIVVAPARSSKTKSLIEGVTFYRAVYQPSDMLLVFATGTKAHAYSKKEYDRMVRSTTPMQNITTGKKHDQGIEMRVFKNGSVIEFRSGTNDALSALGYGVVIFTDYDRSPDDGTGSGDSEGSKFDRGIKRTLSEGSNGICIAESSPSRLPSKDQEGLEPHELPRATGIAGLYNSGNRQMYYWQCPDDDHWFMASSDHLVWDTENKVKPYVQCPHCERKIKFHERENLVGDYMFPNEVDEDGNRQEIEHPDKSIASFHFEGVVAAFNSWDEMVQEYETAQNHFDRTGDESRLQSYTNTTVGKPYIPKMRETDLTIDMLMSRTHPYELPKGIAPEDTRFLLATVDIQNGATARIDVQVTAITDREQWQPIDSFSITESPYRKELDRSLRIEPETYSDDWRAIYDQVMIREYEIAGSTKTIIPAFTLCDSGGTKDDNGTGNTTFNAYQFYRWLQTNGGSARFRLVKGNPRAFKDALHDGWSRISYPNSSKDHKFAARGDIPLLNLNSNVLKNTVYTSMKIVGFDESRMFRPPTGWATYEWYESLLSEEIDDYGNWQKQFNKPNENFDHAQYVFAALDFLGVFTEGWDWTNPKEWARPISEGNINVKEKGTHSIKQTRRRRRRPVSSGDSARWQ